MKDYEERTRRLYNAADGTWPESDAWHVHTERHLSRLVVRWLNDKLSAESNILNAGSGGTTYPLPGIVYDCDVAEKYLLKSKNPIHSSIEEIPCKDAVFDAVICVGSVLNYCDAAAAIAELSRVLRMGGFLLLEFERSDSAEFLFTKRHHQSVFPCSYVYGGQEHILWMYSEKYILSMLNVYNLNVEKSERYHTFSTFSYWLTHRKASGKLIRFDKYVSALSYWWAHNIVILCEKR